jgi:hypothetical protein
VASSALDERQHEACVDAWLEQSAHDHSPDVLLGLFEAALGKLWARTTTTLGEVTLTAIAERVLYTVSETFPLFSSLEVEAIGRVSFHELRQRAGSVSGAELMAGIRFTLVELLTVLGHLTAEILTPDLHAVLSSVALPEARSVDKPQRAPLSRADTESKGN